MTTYEQDLQRARELLYKAIKSNDADDAWALVDYLHNQCILRKRYNMFKKVRYMKVRELIAMDIDIDIYDNVSEEIGIAFCGAVELTAEGMKEFSPVLDYRIAILTDTMGYDIGIVEVDDEEPKIPYRVKLNMAKKFFHSCAGYCAESDYDRWFEIDRE